jgi:hypothetical protein
MSATKSQQLFHNSNGLARRRRGRPALVTKHPLAITTSPIYYVQQTTNATHLYKSEQIYKPLFATRSFASLFERLTIPGEWHVRAFLDGHSPQEKEEWLNTLLQSKSACSVDAEAFLIVMRALVDSNLPDAALRTERWMILLERMAGSSNYSKLWPTRECYLHCIRAWGNSEKDPSIAVIRAERWLRKQLESHDPNVLPNTECFNAFLNICTKGQGSPDVLRKHASKSRQTLEYMIEQRTKEGPSCDCAPNLDSFNYNIRGVSSIRKQDTVDITIEALNLLEHYERTVDPTVRPNEISHCMVLHAIAKKAKQKIKNARNNRQSVWADPSVNGIHEIDAIIEIIEYMKHKQDIGERDYGPTTSSFNILCAAWSHLSSPVHPRAADECEKILRTMTSMHDRGHNDCSPSLE